jgi:hypothetical protein
MLLDNYPFRPFDEGNKDWWTAHGSGHPCLRCSLRWQPLLVTQGRTGFNPRGAGSGNKGCCQRGSHHEERDSTENPFSSSASGFKRTLALFAPAGSEPTGTARPRTGRRTAKDGKFF